MKKSSIHVSLLPVLRDNYIFLVKDVETNALAVVDPAVAAPVISKLLELEKGLALGSQKQTLTYVLNTHHHWDHVGGNTDIKAVTNCRVIGPESESGKIPGIDLAVGEGFEGKLGSSPFRVLDFGGHTLGHIGYYFYEAGILFCGDTLFSLGCGRLFEGTPGQMWETLQRITKLPADTMIYCAHEYTQANSKFALTIEPNNLQLRKVSENTAKLRSEGKPTVPFRLQQELEANPFLRAGSAERFAEIRAAKDNF